MPSRGMGTAGHILIIDDDELVRVGLRELFETAGYDVTESVSGTEALAALQRGPLPHVIVLDIEMPEMNGVAFRMRQLRDPDIAGVPIIVHSLVPASDTIADILQASAYINKPADAQVLLDTVRDVLAVRRPN